VRLLLVGIDGSPSAPGVLGAAVSIAKAHGARLILLRAVGMPADVPQDFWKATDEPLVDLLEHRAMAYLRECAAKLPPELLAPNPCRVEIGAPWEVVCEVAKRENVSLVVIGSHGYSGIDRVLGTTAAKVVNHAHCSVLVVRPEAAGTAAGRPAA
jgi:nucleotide-binding universal stress UspA family protein